MKILLKEKMTEAKGNIHRSQFEAWNGEEKARRKAPTYFNKMATGKILILAKNWALHRKLNVFLSRYNFPRLRKEGFRRFDSLCTPLIKRKGLSDESNVAPAGTCRRLSRRRKQKKRKSEPFLRVSVTGQRINCPDHKFYNFLLRSKPQPSILSFVCFRSCTFLF